MRVSYLAIAAFCLAFYIYEPALLILPAMIAASVGSTAVLCAHSIILAHLDGDDFAGSASTISLQLIQALTQESADHSAAINALKSGQKLLQAIEQIPQYRVARSVIRVLGPLPCLPGLYLIKSHKQI